MLDEAVAAVELARKHVDDVEFSAEDGARTEPELPREGLAARSSPPAPARSTSPTPSATRIPEEYGALIGQRRARRSAIAPSSASTATTISAWRSRTRWRPSRTARARSSARSTASASAPATARSRRSSWRSRPARDRLPYETGIKTEQLYPGQPAADRDHRRRRRSRTRRSSARNAFAHEAGIHQDGFLKERTTYEIIDPKTVGVPESRLVLGKHSGRHALQGALRASWASRSTRRSWTTLYTRFTALADRKKGILDEEIRELARFRSPAA